MVRDPGPARREATGSTSEDDDLDSGVVVANFNLVDAQDSTRGDPMDMSLDTAQHPPASQSRVGSDQFSEASVAADKPVAPDPPYYPRTTVPVAAVDEQKQMKESELPIQPQQSTTVFSPQQQPLRENDDAKREEKLEELPEDQRYPSSIESQEFIWQYLNDEQKEYARRQRRPKRTRNRPTNVHNGNNNISTSDTNDNVATATARAH